MDIEFYNVKKKCKVKVDESTVKKVKIEKLGKAGKIRVRYALKSVDSDGTKLTKFCSESEYNSL
jgi:hypothetical protein